MFLSGLGGGLDIVNTIPLYYLYKDEYDITFGSIRPANPNDVHPCEVFDNCKQIFKVFSNSIIKRRGRYFENKFAELFPNNDVYILSRNLNGRYNDKNLNAEFKKFIAAKGFDEILFVDGGGDSLILTENDASENSQSFDPFSGGDSFGLKMLNDIPSKLVVVASGIDININRFKLNINYLKQLNMFYDSYRLDERMKPYLNEYNEIIRNHIQLKVDDTNKTKSKTATALYYALNNDYGLKPTFVSWDKNSDGSYGVNVNEEMTYVYIVQANGIHDIKTKIYEN